MLLPYVMADVIAIHKYLWQMLVPLFITLVSHSIVLKLADVVAFEFIFLWQMLLPLWLMELPLRVGKSAWMWCMADGITTVSIYFNWSSEMLTRTSSPICGRWYLPMFLFRDGLLLLMYRASLIALLRLWSSLPTIPKLSMVTEWPEMLRVVIYGR